MEQHELSRETQISNGIKLERNRNSAPIYIYIYKRSGIRVFGI